MSDTTSSVSPDTSRLKRTREEDDRCILSLLKRKEQKKKRKSPSLNYQPVGLNSNGFRFGFSCCGSRRYILRHPPRLLFFHPSSAASSTALPLTSAASSWRLEEAGVGGCIRAARWLSRKTRRNRPRDSLAAPAERFRLQPVGLNFGPMRLPPRSPDPPP